MITHTSVVCVCVVGTIKTQCLISYEIYNRVLLSIITGSALDLQVLFIYCLQICALKIISLGLPWWSSG